MLTLPNDRPSSTRTRWLPGLAFSCLAFALPVGLPTLLAPGAAHAQGMPFMSPLVELVPGGEVIADGKTEAILSFVAYRRNGQPLSGMSAKVSGELGKGTLSEVSPGHYQVTLKPGAVTIRGKAKVTLKGKTPAGPLDKSFTVHTAPTAEHFMRVATSPEKIVLKRDTGASISVKIQGPDSASADIQLVSSVGTVQNVTPLGGGSFVAQYTPPTQEDQMYPQLALITAIDKRNPSMVYGQAVIPLVGQTNYPVQAQPGATVLIEINGQPSLPAAADATGMARVPIIVEPGAYNAKSIKIINGQQFEDPLDLKVPHSRRVSLFPVGSAVPADDSVQVPVRAYVTESNGTADTKATVSFTVGSGTVTAATHKGGGVYEAMWTPAFGSSASQASLQVNVADAKGSQSHSLEVSMVPGRAKSLGLNAEPPSLAAGSSNFKLYVKAAGGASGLSGRQIVIDANGASSAGAARDLGSGDYEQAFSATGDANIDVAVGVASVATGNPFNSLLVLPLGDKVAADSRSVQRLAVIAVDAYGYPVANIPVDLQVTSGDGTVTQSVNTGADGIAFASYTAGTASGMMVVKGMSSGKVGEAGFIQTNGAIAPVNAPVSGSAASAALNQAWRGSVGQLTVTRAGGVAVAAATAAPAAATGPAGVPATIALVSEPASGVPGGAVALKISVADGAGRPAAADPAKIVFLASVGQVSTPQAVGPGMYQALLSIPSDATGSINVAASIGSAGSPIISVPLSGAVVSAWGAAPTAAPVPAQPAQQAEPTPEPKKKAEKQKKERTPRAPSNTDRPWLRAGGGYLGGFYGYKEVSQESGGPIYAEPITVGFGEENAAGTFGMQLNAKAWLPFFEYVGFEAGFRGSRWQIQLDDGDSDPIADGLNAINARAHGRYPLDVGNTRLSFGGFLGFHTSDFLYFSQNFDDNDPTAAPTTEYDQLWTIGNSYGAELGIEVGPRFFANGAYEMGFTDYSAIFSDSVELEVGYSVIDNMYISGNVGRFHRVSKIYYGDDKDYVGDLEDQHWIFGLMLGYQM
jgi:hypothetical protein